MKKQTSIAWYLCCAGVIIISLLVFTPLVTPANTYKPMWMGIPYTLWLGILLTIALVVLTYLGSSVHPGKNDKEVK